ncbi:MULTISPECIES: HEAT repeat domain-containing protein [unclassified Thiothrix]|uniref:HEAT repeat domain-containing protein n=1 Tax=unclassified Thiothrix TaxID=2636184 RepID=UPI0025F11AAA|nr:MULTISPECIES: HEAT repeat domain-containing protein [unclassified Thiothrix]
MLTRRRAVVALGAMQAQTAIPALLDLLKDGDVSVRMSAVNALGAMQAQAAIPALLDLLKDGDVSVRRSVVDVLGAMQAQAAIPALLDLLKDGDVSVRINAVRVLGNMQVQVAIPALLDLLNDGNVSVRINAVRVLGNMQVQVAIPALLGLLKDEDSLVHSTTAAALGDMQVPDAVPGLLGLLKETYGGSAAAEALGRMQAKEALPASRRESNDLGDEVNNVLRQTELLFRHLKNGDPEVREKATIDALHMEQDGNLSEVQKRLLRKALSLVDQRTRDKATKQLAEEAEAKARQLPVNQPGLEEKPLTLNELKAKLDVFDQAYADWRERRDAAPNDTTTDIPPTDSDSNPLADPAPFVYEYAYAIATMDEAEGIKLLSHNLYKVREAAARGLANSPFLGTPLLQKLEQQWLATDNPITRQALFHAIDVCLLATEGVGVDKELEALKVYEPTLANARSAASIKPRVEWARIQIQWRVNAIKELQELAAQQLPGMLKDHCLNPDGTDMKPEECTIQ